MVGNLMQLNVMNIVNLLIFRGRFEKDVSQLSENCFVINCFARYV